MECENHFGSEISLIEETEATANKEEEEEEVA